MQISDETLMALADGELSPDIAREVAAAVDRDPLLGARLRKFTETRDLLRELADASQPQVNPALAQMIRNAAAAQAKTVAAPPDTSRTATPTPANLNRQPLAAIAAIFVLAVIGMGLYSVYDDGLIEGLPDSQIAALRTLSSGQSQMLANGDELTIIASYQSGEGELCREFELHGEGADSLQIACLNTDQGWSTRYSEPLQPEAGGYVPASGESGLDTFLSDTGAGPSMTADEEASALSALTTQ